MGPLRFGKVTAVVLAGGKSTRMQGLDKSMLPLNGAPMIQHIVNQLELHFGEIIIGGNTDKYGFLGHRVIPDEMGGIGPLMGICSCLAVSGNDLNFVTACDIPDINISIVKKMLDLSEGADIVIPENEVGDYEPLYAIYRKTVVPVAKKMIREKRLRISDLTAKVKTIFIPFDGSDWYHNINSPDDYYNYKGKP